MDRLASRWHTKKDLDRHQLYKLFLERMESEVASLMGAEGKEKEALAGRSDGPQLVIYGAFGENSGSARRTTAVSRALRRSPNLLTVKTGQATEANKKAATNRLRTCRHPAPRFGGATPQQKKRLCIV